MSAPINAESGYLGKSMKDGINMYFHRINNSRDEKWDIELIDMDDSYNPLKAAENMRKMIKNDDIIAIIGNVGTPTAAVTVPIANQEKILLFGAFTGANLLRNKSAGKYVINYRASYAQETRSIIEVLTQENIRPHQIAFFTQNDTYGDSGYNGALNALAEIESKKDGNKQKIEYYKKKMRRETAHGRYTRNTQNVEFGYSQILRKIRRRNSNKNKNPDIKAFILVGTYAPCAEFIKLAKKKFADAYFFNVSFVGSEKLKDYLGEKFYHNVMITQVVPHPVRFRLTKYQTETVETIVDEYFEDLNNYQQQVRNRVLVGNYVSLEGYIIAKTFVMALNAAPSTPNRENIIKSFNKINIEELGIKRINRIDKNNKQISSRIWFTELAKNRDEISVLPIHEKLKTNNIFKNAILNRGRIY